MKRHKRCFYALSRFDRRVLAMRAGVRGARPRSRSAVARRLEVSKLIVRRSERRGLKRLRQTDRSDGCAQGSASRVQGRGLGLTRLAELAFVQAVAGAADATAGGAVLAATGGPNPDSRGDVAGARKSSGEVPSAAILGPGLGSAESEGDPGPLIAALLAAALLLAATVVAERRRRPAKATEGAAATPGHPTGAGPATPAGEPSGNPWSEAEKTLPPPPWSQPAEASEERPGHRGDRPTPNASGSTGPRHRRSPVDRS